MPRYSALLLAMATLAATAAVSAQSPQPTGPASTQQSQPAPPAPIERAYPTPSRNGTYANETAVLTPGEALASGNRTATTQPVQGLYLRVGQHSVVREISSTPQRTELRVERGLANVNVHDPAHDSLILVDLPGGQTQLLKNGLYTFNADTNTVRVLKGEAYAFPGQIASATPNGKPIKVKENHAVDFVGSNIRSTEFEPYEARADLIPTPYDNARNSDRGYGAYGYGPYGDGFAYGYPYYAYGYGYPWGWGYPYGGYGYPYGIGLGFGYYGGFHGGGFHGGWLPRRRRSWRRTRWRPSLIANRISKNRGVHLHPSLHSLAPRSRTPQPAADFAVSREPVANLRLRPRFFAAAFSAACLRKNSCFGFESG